MIGPGTKVRYRGREVPFEDLPPEVQKQFQQLAKMADTPIAKFILRALGAENLPGVSMPPPKSTPARRQPVRHTSAPARVKVVAAPRISAVQRTEAGGELVIKLILSALLLGGAYLVYRLLG